MGNRLLRDKPISYNSIADVPLDGACTGCGNCAGICPVNAIQMTIDKKHGIYHPFVDEEICVDCNLCRRACPPLVWSNQPKTKKWSVYVGDYIGVYAVHSTDNALRYNCASGGFITTLLECLLENDEITGAVVSRRCADNPLCSEVFLARSVKQIESAKGSIYSPVKFDEIIPVLKTLDPKKERIAVVGLPCHIQGMSKVAEHESSLRKLICFKISLLCGLHPSLMAYNYIVHQLHISEDNLTGINNRGEGWPGYLRITDKNGKLNRFPHGHSMSWGMVLGSPLFTPPGCELCPDPSGFASDVSVCDAWLPRFSEDKTGVNLILIRNPWLHEFVLSMREQGKLKVMACTLDEFIQANDRVFRQKLIGRHVAGAVMLGKNESKYCQNIQFGPKPSITEKIRLGLYYWHVKLIRRFDLGRWVIYIGKPLLFYFKALKLLKR